MEFRKMRRIRQLITQDECVDILKRNTSGVLSVLGDGGYPYGVPLSYVFVDNKLYFHCAKSGHKLDAIKKCDKISFCVIDKDEVVPEKFTTFFRSVVVFGRAKVLENPQEMRDTIEILAKKYSPLESDESLNHEIDTAFSRLCMVEVSIEHISGKVAKELVTK